jgi:hypothetical protein
VLFLALVLSANTVGPVAHASSASKFPGRQAGSEKTAHTSKLADEQKKEREGSWVGALLGMNSALSSPPSSSSSSGSIHSAIAVVID